MRFSWMQPNYAPDEDLAGGEDQVVDTGVDAGGESGETQPQSLRQQLEKNFEANREAGKGQDPEGRDKKGRYTSSARRAAAEDGGADPAQQTQPQGDPSVPAPEAFAKEAKAEWANTPPLIQQAVLKREQDMAKGVEELKAKYSSLDQALAPHMEGLRRVGRSPAEAVQQLFGWFQALSQNPREAFPALARSFNLDLAQLITPQAGEQPQPDGQQPAGEVTPAVQQYINRLEQQINQLGQAFQQKIGSVEQTFAQQNQAKTQEILDSWSKDKKYFGEVRQTMAQLIQSGAVPLSANGQVDLDAAYDRAIWAVPDVRAKVMADQDAARAAEAKAKQEAEAKAQRDQANKARRAAVSTVGGAPGAPSSPQGKVKGRGKSVRESLSEAMEQLSDN